MKEYELSLTKHQDVTDKKLKYERALEFFSPIADFSYFDYVLTSEWRKAMSNGIFRFKLDSPLPTRCLAGKFSFLIQLNPERYSEKRPSEIKQTSKLNQEFDKSRFNFTRIASNEILFAIDSNEDKLRIVPKSAQKTCPSSENDRSSYIIINNSPIEFGHSLIVPQLKQGLNQVLTEDSIQLAVRLSILSQSVHLIIGFNSLNAYASVNHLHLHAYYINTDNYDQKFPFPIQNVTHAELIGKHLWFINEDIYFLPAFSLQLIDFNNDMAAFSKRIFMVTDYFSANNIPHNCVLVKSEPLRAVSKWSSPRGKSSKSVTIRAVIWPKKPSYDVPVNSKSIVFAMCELSGHILLQNEEDFNSLKEQDIEEINCQSKLDNERMAQIKENLGLKFDG